MKHDDSGRRSKVEEEENRDVSEDSVSELLEVETEDDDVAADEFEENDY